MVAAVLGVVVGGRIGSYFLYDGWRSFGTDPLAILRVWEGGMASHGGMIGVILAVAWFARSAGIPFLHLADLVASAAPAGLFFGRVANFINGELWGWRHEHDHRRGHRHGEPHPGAAAARGHFRAPQRGARFATDRGRAHPGHLGKRRI